MALCIVPLTSRFGILGTCVAVTAAAFVVQGAVIPTVARLLSVPISVVVRPLLAPMVGTAAMMAAMLLAQRVAVGPDGLLSLLGLSAVGAVVYLVVMLPSEREVLRKVRVVVAEGGGW
jgi:hypothetical protein